MQGRLATERVLLALALALLLLAPLLEVPLTVALAFLALVVVLNAVHGARARPR